VWRGFGSVARRAAVAGRGAVRSVAVRDAGPAAIAQDFLWENGSKWPSSG